MTYLFFGKIHYTIYIILKEFYEVRKEYEKKNKLYFDHCDGFIISLSGFFSAQ